jgi:hypothetical protein
MKYIRLAVAVAIVGLCVLWAYEAASRIIESPAVEQEVGCQDGAIEFTINEDGTVTTSCPGRGISA